MLLTAGSCGDFSFGALMEVYVEANRERALMGDIDPCMIVNPNHALRFRYTYLREAMQEYSGTDKDVKHRKDLEDELRKRAVELLSLIHI